MSIDLPVPFRDGITSSVVNARAGRARRGAELEVFTHGLRAQVTAVKDQQDTQAVSDAVTYALEEEIRFFDHGMNLAGGSPTKAHLVARKLEILTAVNDRRITRTFRG